jgi:hypothetical protein
MKKLRLALLNDLLCNLATVKDLPDTTRALADSLRENIAGERIHPLTEIEAVAAVEGGEELHTQLVVKLEEFCKTLQLEFPQLNVTFGYTEDGTANERVWNYSYSSGTGLTGETFGNCGTASLPSFVKYLTNGGLDIFRQCLAEVAVAK